MTGLEFAIEEVDNVIHDRQRNGFPRVAVVYLWLHTLTRRLLAQRRRSGALLTVACSCGSVLDLPFEDQISVFGGTVWPVSSHKGLHEAPSVSCVVNDLLATVVLWSTREKSSMELHPDKLVLVFLFHSIIPFCD